MSATGAVIAHARLGAEDLAYQAWLSGIAASGRKKWTCSLRIGFFWLLFSRISILRAVRRHDIGLIQPVVVAGQHRHARGLPFGHRLWTFGTMKPTWLTTDPTVPPVGGASPGRSCRYHDTPGNITLLKSPVIPGVLPPMPTKIFLLASTSFELRCQCPMVTPASLGA